MVWYTKTILQPEIRETTDKIYCQKIYMLILLTFFSHSLSYFVFYIPLQYLFYYFYIKFSCNYDGKRMSLYETVHIFKISHVKSIVHKIYKIPCQTGKKNKFTNKFPFL